MPILVAAAVILLGGALTFGMTGRKIRRRKRRPASPEKALPADAPKRAKRWIWWPFGSSRKSKPQP